MSATHNLLLSTPDDPPLPRPYCPPHLAVFVEHEKRPTANELGRPARPQLTPEEASKIAYQERGDDYNIWYHRYPTQRSFDFFDRTGREPALTMCNPFRDSGWTQADFDTDLKNPPICMFFARGTCTLGEKCRFLHRVPTREDDDNLTPVVDIFGRERHGTHREDMDGIGSFQTDCRTLFVADIKLDRSDPNFHQSQVNHLFKYFGLWGPVESIRVIPNKGIAFIRFQFRAGAEFAKMAMTEQPLGMGDQLFVRWAHPDRNPRAAYGMEYRAQKAAEEVVHRRMDQLGLPQDTLKKHFQGTLLDGIDEADGEWGKVAMSMVTLAGADPERKRPPEPASRETKKPKPEIGPVSSDQNIDMASVELEAEEAEIKRQEVQGEIERMSDILSSLPSAPALNIDI
ncbi:MAG: hypothetical protein KVP17_002064 [Porospora cf. gigantea B]|uniref:uncharacterized protein n=2 Tax=Porospora cf. gigantea B TaxID=2853592 RepID=UPI003571B572|nr:MAG: hypothetical protein KVP17_002064 [Porospora cf. gigantea B]